MVKGEVVGRVVERELRGDPVQVGNALRTLHARGDLVSWTPVGYQRGPEPIAVVRVRLVKRVPPRRRVRARWVVSGVVAGAGVLAGGGYLAYVLTRTLLLHVAAVLGVLAVVVLLLGWVAAGQAGACPGLHCPGCKCR